MSAAAFRPELLAPAGNMEMALAALDAGADALYVGLNRFSARERADNFDAAALGALLDHAHRLERRIHVAVNTLVKETELDAVAEQLAVLTRLRPDAVIVQDPGVVRLIRDYFPALTIHASTQMGIHNAAGVRAAARRGIKRVILERQMTLPEIARVAADAPIELEVFIHGSLCSSLSGRCLFSSWFGGDSGNRGRCKQPCRRVYQAADGRRGCFFSLADLDGLELVAAFRRLKIASFKIEGRLRSPDYVWKTVRAYRLALDARTPEEWAEARKILDSAAARRSTAGFYRGDPRRLALPEELGVFGVLAGRVTRAERGALTVAVSGRLHLGDRLRLVPPDGGEGTAFTLIQMTNANAARPVVVAGNGQVVRLTGDFEARPGYLLYKIGENGCDYRRRAATLPAARTPVAVELSVDGDGFHATLPLLPGAQFDYPFALQPARQHPLTAATTAAELSSGVPEPWCAGAVAVTLGGAFFCPAAELKQMRRAFWQWAAPRLATVDPCPDAAAGLRRFRADYAAAPMAAVAGTVPVDAMPIGGFVAEDAVAAQRARIAQAYAAGVRDFAVGGWHGWEWLRGLDGVRGWAVPPFPVCNSLAAAEARALGAVGAVAWPELERAARQALAQHAGMPVAAPEPGRQELLVSRAQLAVDGLVTDGRGHEFVVEYDPTAGLTRLFPPPEAASPYADGELK